MHTPCAPASILSVRELAESLFVHDDRSFRELLEQIPAAAYTCDNEGLITYFNERAVDVWGRRPRLKDQEDRFCGSFKLFAVDGSPLRHNQCWMAKALQAGLGYNEQEIIVERPDGGRRWVLAYANPIREQSGSLCGAVNVLVDITGRKREEQAVHASLQLSELANKAKDRFLAVLSHELRGPLSPVMLTVAAMEADQVFSNLLRNAIKFTSTGGNIHLRTWNVEGSGQIGIEIQDTGVGIRADALAGIFEPFDQGEPDTAQHFGGLGLGLSIVKAVIELHGGTIVAASEGRDKGAVFTIQLNIAPAATVDQAALGPSELRGTTGLRLLIVEDHNDTANAMARLLKSEGYKVSIASSAAAALQATAAAQFDIMVSDIGLPDATGYDLMMQINKCSRIKGIALSGYGGAEDVQRALGAGFLAHIVKPVDVPHLVSVINRVALAHPKALEILSPPHCSVTVGLP